MITIVGICHDYQHDEENPRAYLVRSRHHYLQLLQEVQRTSGATLIGEEIRPDVTDTFARKVATESGARFVALDMSPDEWIQRGFPERYFDSGYCKHADMETYHCQREHFMIDELLRVRTDQENAILVCGSFHTYRLAALLRERAVECNPLTLVGEVPLESPEQLPDIPGTHSLSLTWDAVTYPGDDRPHTVIRDGDRVLFSQWANWQAVDWEFGSICKVLKQRYGDRLIDVVPTSASDEWLCGDHYCTSWWLENAKRMVFTPQRS